ncbi:hypothetical protein XBO1_1310006 [Xenorhabdus bovienii str. oregonense]|uniref:TRAP C4-dicarboxylate transport system permease DctM subunit domain-containing protein n=1 Tax=Xenorhabdus bovienii str. oregonense TaxID=1398202 RepID=A0A077NRB0_XENBV|nr:hypothetical protein XBO1_1310006 [Xenorhabdus bovienii str. oregonense]
MVRNSIPDTLDYVMAVMVVCIVLSMGLPSTALYIVVAVTVSPILIKSGILPLAAHFFVFWFGVLSNITPPVALASYTAASSFLTCNPKISDRGQPESALRH